MLPGVRQLRGCTRLPAMSTRKGGRSSPTAHLLTMSALRQTRQDGRLRKRTFQSLIPPQSTLSISRFSGHVVLLRRSLDLDGVQTPSSTSIRHLTTILDGTSGWNRRRPSSFPFAQSIWHSTLVQHILTYDIYSTFTTVAGMISSADYTM